MRSFQNEGSKNAHEDKHYQFCKNFGRTACNLCGLSLFLEMDYGLSSEKLNLKNETKIVTGSAGDISNELLQTLCCVKSDHDNSLYSDLDGCTSSGGSVSESAAISSFASQDEELNSTECQQGCLSLWKNLSKSSVFANGRATSFLSKFADKLSMGTSKNFPTLESDIVLDPSSLRSAQRGYKRPFRYFTYAEISLATSSFHPDNLIGKGGYAEVYKGLLSSGELVAVKRLFEGEGDDSKERAFLTELGIIGHVYHPNTSSLLGFCIEDGTYLILPFLPHGSLSSFLHGPKAQCLVWPIRYKIAVGIARGLHYLHKYCERRIIHRDIKASNILLGPDYEPQISDFGLAKWLPEQWTHHTVTAIEGTYGYLAPEYLMHGIVDEKTDVFAFGILLLELITGHRPLTCCKQNSLTWAQPFLETYHFEEIVDYRLYGVYDSNELQHMLIVAAMCVQQSAIRRPCMTKVLKLLMDVGAREEFVAP